MKGKNKPNAVRNGNWYMVMETLDKHGKKGKTRIIRCLQCRIRVEREKNIPNLKFCGKKCRERYFYWKLKKAYASQL